MLVMFCWQIMGAKVKLVVVVQTLFFFRRHNVDVWREQAIVDLDKRGPRSVQLVEQLKRFLSVHDSMRTLSGPVVFELPWART